MLEALQGTDIPHLALPSIEECVGFQVCLRQSVRDRLVTRVPAASGVSEPEDLWNQAGSEHQQFQVPDVGCALA